MPIYHVKLVWRRAEQIMPCFTYLALVRHLVCRGGGLEAALEIELLLPSTLPYASCKRAGVSSQVRITTK